MSPTVFRFKGYRFFFFSREEDRIHIHVIHAEGEAKIWIEPQIEIETSYGLNSKQLKEILEQVNEHENEIRESWNNHFRS
ncbi:DUF4160 domain-containing protein [Gracilimonas mengyeensis]|uniref:DUF4160 domain-containing protein n=1 Tax=Gracilimonas mengyeensis TaxID=1302730 RepID=A0A521ANT9_9BACT|nr:DUF4160 domain-containing protein [Gracilimonas mengyeensis]SMO36476.1 protein of unknown function [Gracilimonas mengyeensis]